MPVDYGEAFFVVSEEYRKALREPFPKEFIEQMPKAGRMLDFINHAVVTDRLNQVAPDATWTVDEQWEVTKHLLDKKTGEIRDVFEFWVRGTMTIGSVSRVEYGDGDDPKDAIGNFVKRAAMRFGVGIDLWIRNEAAKLDSVPVEPAGGATTSRGKAGTDGGAATEHRPVGAVPPDVEVDAVGAPTSAGAGGPSSPPAPDARALTSQVRTLLRLAEELRWSEAERTHALAEVFPGVSSFKELSQEQARELIPIWTAASKSVRMTNEQVEIVKALASFRDAKAVAERLFGFKVPNLHTLTQPEGERLIAALREARAQGAA